MAHTQSANFVNDVFLSYAHDDDLGGWVKQFAKRLRQELDRQLGSKEAVVWSDGYLPQVGPLAESLTTQLRQSAVLLVVLSDSSAKSDWCKYEISGFIQADARAAIRRLFIVRKEPEKAWPHSLCSPDGNRLLFHDFLDEDKDRLQPVPINLPSGDIDPRADSLIRRLCRDLIIALNALSEQSTEAQSNSTDVFLAPSEDDSPEHYRLAQILRRENLSIQDVDGSLALEVLEKDKSRFFVQFLSAKNAFNIPENLLKKARRGTKKLLLRLGPEVKIEDTRGSYHDLLQEVQAAGLLRCETFDEFAGRVVSELRGRRRAGPRIPCLVALRTTPEDEGCVAQFSDYIKGIPSRLSIRPLLVDPNLAPSQNYRNELAASGFVFLWGRAQYATAGADLDIMFEDGPPPAGDFDAESLACFDPAKPYRLPLRKDVL